MQVAGITAALTATAAAGYYAYDQYVKRYPRYQEQAAMFKEVRQTALYCPQGALQHTQSANRMTNSMRTRS